MIFQYFFRVYNCFRNTILKLHTKPTPFLIIKNTEYFYLTHAISKHFKSISMVLCAEFKGSPLVRDIKTSFNLE